MVTAAHVVPLLILILAFCSTVLVTEGLPLPRRERGTMGEDLIAGEAFLSMLMGSRSHRSRYKTTTITTTTTTTSATIPTPTTTTPATLPTTTDRVEQTSYIREARSSPAQEPSDTNRVNDIFDYSDKSSDRFSANTEDGMIISVRVSSSVERSRGGVKEADDPIGVASEEHPSIVAEVNKSIFAVEEGDPITSNSEHVRQYEPLPSPLPYEASSMYNPSTIIYHNNPRDTNRARSVSYSTVIQSIPGSDKKAKSEESKPHVESVAETKDYYVTSKYNPSEYNDSLDKRRPYETSSTRYYEPTERNWGIPEKNYEAPRQNTPMVYVQPEQNYEVDEAVSVETNGRAHGIQEPQKPKKPDDNQKVGYVVEGRNYRKYRVEERTSDGFIVGEYGVVSHDDGSLRGVRYTADGTINPRLIYDALMKFLSL